MRNKCLGAVWALFIGLQCITAWAALPSSRAGYNCTDGQCIGYLWDLAKPEATFPTREQACAFGGTQYRPPVPMSWCQTDGYT